MKAHRSATRRDFLRLSALAAGGVVLTACAPTSAPAPAPTSAPSSATSAPTSAPSSPTTAPAAGGVIRWWDHFLPLAPLHKTIWDAYSKDHPDVIVTYTQFTPADLGKSLQLAYRSRQAPDIHALAGVGVPVSRLHKEGWFAPLDPYVTDEWKKAFPPGSFLEGITAFGGKVYSFPIFSFRQHTTLNWFNKKLMADAGFDPEVGPKTWDDFRQAAKKITQKGGGTVFGWIQGIQFVERNMAHLVDLAQTAGAPGGIDWKTGQYIWHTEPFIRALEFLLSVHSDRCLFPGSMSLNARTGRARWATGAAGMFLDGPWNIGVLLTDFKDFMDNTGVAQVPVPDASKPSYVYHAPVEGSFWVSSQATNPKVAADILKRLSSQEYYIGLAERMDQPPLDLSAVDKAKVHPTYKMAMQFFKENVRLAPEPLAKNPAVADVLAEMKDVRPHPGEIMQGAFSGDIKDYKAALKTYSDQMSAERERAIKVVQAKGTKVSLDDWVFSNWDPAKDYGAESYK